MDQKIDFSTFTLDELYSSAEGINRRKYPQRASEIDALIQQREREQPPQVKKVRIAGEKAGRFERLVAVLVDVAIQFMLAVPLFMYFGMEALSEPTLVILLSLLAYGLVISAILHGYLLYRYGQTIGKYIMSIRIENLDGTKAGLKKIVFLRWLPMTLIVYVPFVGNIVSILNPLFIFGKQRRCLHDYIAKTKVSYVGK